MADNFRSRNFACVLYPEDDTHVKAMLTLKSGGYKFAAILHDRDVYDTDDSVSADTEDDTPADTGEVGKPKKQHWHVVICFPSARWRTAVAAELGIAENYLQKCSSVDGALLYMTHFELPGKAQYEYSEVFGHKSLLERLKKLMSGEDTNSRAASFIQLLRECPQQLTPAQLVDLACRNGLFDVFCRIPHWIMQDELQRHNRYIAEYGDIDPTNPSSEVTPWDAKWYLNGGKIET